MDHSDVVAIIQARMSSTRFPGKVLAPFNGKPIIACVIDRVAEVIACDQIVVATSTASSDDPLAGYLQDLGISVCRGPLDNVFERFQLCVQAHPCNWFIRICADSPCFDSTVLERLVPYRDQADIDLVTNFYRRTFPKGHSAELVKTATFEAIDPRFVTPDQAEHVTRYYYDHSDAFEIVNVESGDPALGNMSFVVDTVEDLKRLEKIASENALQPVLSSV